MNLFRFANPEYFYLLLLLPVIFLFWLLNAYRRKKAIKKLGETELINRLIPDRSGVRPFLKMLLQVIVVALLAILLARPQFGSKIEEVKRQG